MVKYTVKRILMLIPTILLFILLMFAILYLIPGSSISRMRIHGNGDALDSVFTFFNAGDNFFTKYLRYCYDVLVRFDFGSSSTTRINLLRELNYRFRNTLILLAGGVVTTLLVGVPLGIYAAVRKNRLADRIVSIASLIFSAIPGYSTALLLTLFFAVYLRVLPLLSSYTQPIAFVLPVLTICLGGAASVVRMTRTNMIETLGQPYITALRAKGLKEFDVLYRHALKNALIPVVAVLGSLISQLLCWSLVVEYFFSVPGLSSYMLRAVGSREHIPILGCAVLVFIILAVTNTAIELMYALVNPQIKLRYTKGRTGRLGSGYGKETKNKA